MPANLLRRRASLLATPVMIAGASIALTGCSRTRAALERHAPTIEAQSPRSVTQISACISDNLKGYEGSVDYVPNAQGATLTYNLGTLPFMSVRILDLGSSRRVMTFGPMTVSSKVKRHRLDAVRECL